MKANHSKVAFELFYLMGNHSADALGRIMQLYERPLVLFVATILLDQQQAKEVFHYTMEKAWTNREKLAQLDNPVAWLFLVAKNRALNVRRKNYLNHTVPLDLAGDKFLTRHPADAIEAKDLVTHILKALQILSPREREVFRLNMQVGWDYPTIAFYLGLSESTVRTQRNNALKKIRKHFGC